MIRVFNSATYRFDPSERFISLDEVNIVTQKICSFSGAPYILFEHKDFPLGRFVQSTMESTGAAIWTNWQIRG